MRNDTNLLRPLDVTDLPPSKVDLRQAVRVGRRRVRIRGVAAGGLTAAVVLATVLAAVRVAGGSHGAPPATATSPVPVVTMAVPALGTCTLADFRLPGIDLTSQGVVTSADGVYTAAVDLATNDLLRWKGDLIARIKTQVPGAMNVYAVNSTGDFLGGAGNKSPFVYRDHTFNLIPVPAGTTGTTPIGLNDHGDALVVVTVGGTSRAAIWPAAQPAAVTLLQVPAGWASDAVGIAADGTVAGELDKGGVKRPAVWSADGTLRILPVLASDPSPAMTAVDGDWVLARATRWNLRTGSVEPVTGIRGERLDSFGRVYGEQPDITPPHPAVWVNGKVTRLPADPQRPLGMVIAVSADGTRITSVLQADNPPDPRPVVWTCH